MALLRLYREGHCVATLELGDADCVVGRADDCDLVLTSASSSRRHFSVGTNPKGEGYVLRDLESENGTFVDGIREYTRVLKQRTIIQVGEEVILFEPAGKEPKRTSTESMPYWAQKAIKDNPRIAQLGERNETLHIAPAIQRRVQAERLSRLRPHVVLLGKGEERVFALDHDVNTVGFGQVRVALGPGKKGSTTVLAEIYREKDDSFWVRAKGLFGKVLVDGQPRARSQLRPGTVLGLGEHQLRFEQGLDG